jgi:hypothetical protein
VSATRRTLPRRSHARNGAHREPDARGRVVARRCARPQTRDRAAIARRRRGDTAVAYMMKRVKSARKTSTARRGKTSATAITVARRARATAAPRGAAPPAARRSRAVSGAAGASSPARGGRAAAGARAGTGGRAAGEAPAGGGRGRGRGGRAAGEAPAGGGRGRGRGGRAAASELARGPRRAMPGRLDFGAPIAGFFARQPARLRPILEQLRDLVQAAAPDATSSIKWGMPFFEVNGNMMCALGGHKSHVNLVLAGPPAAFADPDHRLSGEGKTGRHLKLRTLDEIPRDAVRSWLVTAAALARDKG